VRLAFLVLFVQSPVNFFLDLFGSDRSVKLGGLSDRPVKEHLFIDGLSDATVERFKLARIVDPVKA